MQETKYTSGPWHVNDKRGGAFSGQTHVMTGEGYGIFSICMMQGGQHMDSPEQKANARLIAAAPEMADELGRIHVGTSITTEHFNRIQRLLDRAVRGSTI